MLPFSVMGVTMATYCGQNMGAGALDRIRTGIRHALILTWVWSLGMILLSYTVAPRLIYLVTGSENPTILATATRYLKFDTLFYFAPAGISILRNGLQGMGDHVTPIVSSSIELVGKIVASVVLARIFQYWGIIIAEPIVWNRMPKEGHIAVFDRTWYGRVMVERIEGFCTEEEWRRAYQEINEMEAHLVSSGAVVLKFWLHIDKDEQERRFKERQQNPEKQWKITEEDWRNREKWTQYEEAVDEMLQKTSTAYAPWHILESKDKKYARIKALKTVIEAIEKKME